VSSGRLSLNQITVNRLSIEETVEICRSSGINSIGLWREKVAEVGVESAAQIVAAAGLKVSSLCRGGFFAAPGAAQDNRAAVDEAAALGADVLVLVSGGLATGSRDLQTARQIVCNGIEDLVPYAARRGVRLGIEPLHPMFCADRSVVCTLGEALELAERFPPESLGVIIDVYHVWWDPTLGDQLARARGRVAGFHLNDWVLPLPAGALLGRGLPGTGCIDLPRLVEQLDATGYTGPVEVEVLNEEVWDAPAGETLRQITDSVKSLFDRPTSIAPKPYNLPNLPG
jgi:sugar phosphate isomerase/epimerase